MNDIIYLMMIFIKLNIHKHNLYANINLNNAIIIMFSYYDCYGRGSKQKFSLLFGDFYSILHLVLLLFINNF